MGSNWGGIKQILDSQAFEFAFLFLLFQRTHCVLSGFPDDLCTSFGVVWIYGSWNHLYQPLVPDGAARRCSELRLNLTALVQLSLLSRRSPSSGSDAGAEQWYKTIAKLMQGRNSIPHLHSEHRCGLSSLDPRLELVATWLILPVVICLS